MVHYDQNGWSLWQSCSITIFEVIAITISIKIKIILKKLTTVTITNSNTTTITSAEHLFGM
jgi:hypothetical protein